MVGASDLAFRLLLRRHGAQLCYTEMLFAHRFLSDPSYREAKLRTTPADRPLVVQFCATDAPTLAGAARLAAPQCDAIDLNLGCPLPSATQPPFGAALLAREHWPLVGAMVAALAGATPLPVFCKIRLLESVEATVELARLLEARGCRVLCVHGRAVPPPREHRAQRQWPADLDAIASVARAVRIPVLSNGNTRCGRDVQLNVDRTGAAGVMSAEGLLQNPLLFEKLDEPSPRELGEAALEYLRLAAEWPPGMRVVRSHIMWMLGKSGSAARAHFAHSGPFTSQQLRLALLGAESVAQFEELVHLTLLSDG
ncbi:hypothetical protein AB1Y20_006411 [Prymnesium parvum]